MEDIFGKEKNELDFNVEKIEFDEDLEINTKLVKSFNEGVKELEKAGDFTLLSDFLVKELYDKYLQIKNNYSKINEANKKEINKTTLESFKSLGDKITKEMRKRKELSSKKDDFISDFESFVNETEDGLKNLLNSVDQNKYFYLPIKEIKAKYESYLKDFKSILNKSKEDDATNSFKNKFNALNKRIESICGPLFGPLSSNYSGFGLSVLESTTKIFGIYEGDFKNGVREGKGKDVWANGDYYEGDFKNGVKEGKGKYVYSNGNYYEGDYNNNVREGKGKYVYSNGDYYIGDYKNGVCEGKGKYVYSNGDYYEGDYNNDVREGKGKYVYSNGDYYEGDCKNGVREGKGKYVWANGDYYEGDYKNDVKEGNGKFVAKKGDVYNGPWKNDKRNGYEPYTVNGKTYYRWWKDDRLGYSPYDYEHAQLEHKNKIHKIISIIIMCLSLISCVGTFYLQKWLGTLSIFIIPIIYNVYKIFLYYFDKFKITRNIVNIVSALLVFAGYYVNFFILNEVGFMPIVNFIFGCTLFIGSTSLFELATNNFEYFDLSELLLRYIMSSCFLLWFGFIYYCLSKNTNQWNIMWQGFAGEVFLLLVCIYPIIGRLFGIENELRDDCNDILINWYIFFSAKIIYVSLFIASSYPFDFAIILFILAEIFVGAAEVCALYFILLYIENVCCFFRKKK